MRLFAPLVLLATLAAPGLCGPSLWEQWGGNPAHTGMSVLTGPVSANVVNTWSFMSNGEIVASPVIDNEGSVIIGSKDGNLYKLNGTTGEQVWAYNVNHSRSDCVCRRKDHSCHKLCGHCCCYHWRYRSAALDE